VLTPRELEARTEVLYERYVTVITIEARTLLSMLRTKVVPAAIRAQTEVAESLAATSAAGVSSPATEAKLRSIVELITKLGSAIEAVDKALEDYPDERVAHAMQVADVLVPAMDAARAASDALEEIIPDDLWPLPTYAEMLFVR
jgi:glutamine synthetase